MLTSYSAIGSKTTYKYGDDDFPTSVTQSINILRSGYVDRYATYNADGEMTQSWDNSSPVNYVSEGYDADGRVCYVAPVNSTAACSSPPTGSGVTTYAYNAANERTGMSDNYGATSPAQTNDTYVYDLSGNLTSATDDNAQTTTYAYNDGNDVTCVSYQAIPGSSCANGAPSSTNSVVDDYYYPNGEFWWTSTWLPNTGLGNSVIYSNYNALGEVGTIDYPAPPYGEVVTYTYDAVGDYLSASYEGSAVGGEDTSAPNANDQVASSTSLGGYSSPADTYNSYDRVQSATNPAPSGGGSLSGADTYIYNADGDVTSDQLPGGESPIYSTYSIGDELTSVDNPNHPASTQYQSLGYTTDGQRCVSELASTANNSLSCAGTAPAGSTGYGWNAYGQMCWSGTTTTPSASCSSPPSGTTTYTYDGNGLRMKEVSPTATETFAWNTVSGGSNPELLSDGTNSYIYGPLLFGGSAPIEQINEATDTASFIASTPSGVQAVFSGGSPSTLQELAAYSVWGVQTIQSGTTATPFSFQGGYSDSSGLEFLINRYYDPSTSQFMNIDPEVATTLQPYSMDGDDPLNDTDPLGLASCASSFAAYAFCLGLLQQQQREDDAFLETCAANPAWCHQLQQTTSAVNNYISDATDQGFQPVSMHQVVDKAADTVADTVTEGWDAFDTWWDTQHWTYELAEALQAIQEASRNPQVDEDGADAVVVVIIILAF